MEHRIKIDNCCTVTMNDGEIARGKLYSPFRDHPAPNYLKFAKRIEVMPTKDCGFRRKTIINGQEITIEYRGNVPLYAFGLGVVGHYDPYHFYRKHPRKAKQAGKVA